MPRSIEEEHENGGDAGKVSPGRQLELARKYGASEEQISAILSGNLSDEEKKLAVRKIIEMLSNAIIDKRVDLKDVEDVSALVGNRFATNKDDYGFIIGKK